MTASRSVLVTGGNGFIGRHLVRRLLCDGCKVLLLQRSSDQVSVGTELLRIDRFEPANIMAALAGRHFDWIFHLAGYGVYPRDRDTKTMFDINVNAVRALVEGASFCSPRAVVVAGSGSEYRLDGIERPVTEDHPLEPYKLYGASKAAGTLCSTALAASRHIPFAACRIFGVYGPGEAPHRLLPSLICGRHGSGRIPLSPGVQRRDFMFVDDLVDALVKVAVALEREPRQFILNVGTGRPISVREFVHIAAAVLGIGEDRLGFGDIPARPDEPMMFSGNSSRLQALTGWKATIEPREGVRRSVDASVFDA